MSGADGEDIYIAEQIIDHREKGGHMQFLVRWEGWSKEDDTWEPRENILDNNLLRAYAEESQLTLSDIDDNEHQDEDEEEGKELEIKMVLASRTLKGGALQYLMKWEDDDETWEAAASFPLADWDVVAEFWQRRGVLPPPAAYGVSAEAKRQAEEARRAAVERIVACRTVKGGGLEYLIGWRAGETRDTWEPAAEWPLELAMVRAFWERRGEAPPPAASPSPSAAAGSSVFASAAREATSAAAKAAVAAKAAADAKKDTATQKNAAEKEAAHKTETAAADKAAADKAAAEKLTAETAAAKAAAKAESEVAARTAEAAAEAAKAAEAAAYQMAAKRAAAEKAAAERRVTQEAEKAAAAKAAVDKAAAAKAAVDKAAASQSAAAAIASSSSAAAVSTATSAPAPGPASMPASTAPVRAVTTPPGSTAWIAQLPARWRIGAVLGGTAAGKTQAIEQLRAAGLLNPAAVSSPHATGGGGGGDGGGGGGGGGQAWPDDMAIISAIAASPLVDEASRAEMAQKAEGELAAAAAATAASSASSLRPWLTPAASTPAAGPSSCSSSTTPTAAAPTEPSDTRKAEIAMERLGSVGLNSLPVWLRPYSALSNGQRARADVARSLTSGLAIDDFGSTVDARNASVCAAGIGRSVRSRSLERVVVASVHESLLPWLGADWAYFPAIGSLYLNPFPGSKPQLRLRYHEEGETEAQLERRLKQLPEPPRLARALRETTASTLFSCGKKTVLRSAVTVDHAASAAAAAFDFKFDGKGHAFEEPSLPALPKRWRVGLVLGPSGSGKSTVLRRLCERFGAAAPPRTAADLGGEGEAPRPGAWPDDAPAASAVPGGASAIALFGRALADAAGRRPFAQFSRGERTLLALARLCAEQPAGAPTTAVAAAAAAVSSSSSSSSSSAPRLAVADEFTSFVDRTTAASAAAATRAAWLRGGPSDCLVCASVHDDVLLELRPDWTYDAKLRKLTKYTWAAEDLALDEDVSMEVQGNEGVHVGSGESHVGKGVALGSGAAHGAAPCAPTNAELFAPPVVDIVVRETMPTSESLDGGERRRYNDAKWQLFKDHHYMSHKLQMGAWCAIARWGRQPVGFIAVLPKPGAFPKGETRVLFREHRLVVLPEFQGLGIGSRLSEATGSRYLLRGRRYCSRSAHVNLRDQRRRSSRWLENEILSGTKATDHMGAFGSAKGKRAEREKALQAKQLTAKAKKAAAAASKVGASKAAASKADPPDGGGEEDEDEDEEDGDEARVTYFFAYVGDEEEQRLSKRAAQGFDISAEVTALMQAKLAGEDRPPLRCAPPLSPAPVAVAVAAVPSAVAAGPSAFAAAPSAPRVQPSDMDVEAGGLEVAGLEAARLGGGAAASTSPFASMGTPFSAQAAAATSTAGGRQATGAGKTAGGAGGASGTGGGSKRKSILELMREKQIPRTDA